MSTAPITKLGTDTRAVAADTAKKSKNPPRLYRGYYSHKTA